MTPHGAGEEADAAVVGGGLVGACIAWGLARQGQRVVVLDEGDMAVRASRGNFALVWVQGKGLGLPPYSRWTLASSEAWPTLQAELAEETGETVCFERPGGFHVCLSENEMAARAALLARFHAQPGVAGYRTEMLDRTQLGRYLPHLGPRVAGASYSPVDGHVNSLRLFRALHKAFERRRVSYRPSHAVRGIEQRAGGFTIATTAGPVRAAKVVLAAGNANATLAPMVGLTAPMKPERGQIIVTERVRPFLRYPLSTVRQTDEGTVMIGDSREEGTDPALMNRPINSVMAARAVEIFPMLGALQVVRSWRAIRVMPADGFPIYDQSLACPGAFLATCHSGVTLAAAHAYRLAPMIARGQLDAEEVGAFSARRFDVQTQ
ncbi:MAG: FAD-binding oxidoreductase [Rubrivivax sp.]|nr:FAD-binding oxidoreductase [Rubrivivax sp.]